MSIFGAACSTPQGHLLLHALRPGAPTHFADLAKAYEMLPPETQDWVRIEEVVNGHRTIVIGDFFMRSYELVSPIFQDL